MNKVIRDGKVAVLYSPGFGAGWSTWNNQEELVFHPTIVHMVESNERHKITKEFMDDLGYPQVYCGGAEDLTIAWLPEGSRFTIEEYDGSESIRTVENLTYIA